MIAQNNDSHSIGEGEFETSTVSIDVGGSHPQLGFDLTIRLVNPNQVPAGFTPANSPDLKVDFSLVRLTAVSSVPEPSSILPMMVWLVPTMVRRRKRSGSV